MKMNGQAFEGPNEAILVLPRNGQDLVFKARAVLDYSEFDTLCPSPKPKKIKTPQGEEKSLFTEPTYLQAIDHWGKQKMAYTVIKSLVATIWLEWEKVKLDDPTTWLSYQQEFRDAFFSEREINRIVNCCWEANSIDEDKLQEARARFLASQVQASSTPD